MIIIDIMVPLLERIASALERIAPDAAQNFDLDAADAFVWHSDPDQLEAIEHVNRVELALLKGINSQIDQLAENTQRFANGFSANNALLWGARGTGKSSLVKAVHADIIEHIPNSLA